jgi:hypothetical protein
MTMNTNGAVRKNRKEPASDGGAGSVFSQGIALPKGGGATRGIGEKFGVNPGSLTVPLASSQKRSGFGPQLSFLYDSGSGNGPLGFGRSLSLPAITRKTDKGLPRYLDGAEDFVPILDGAGNCVSLPRATPATSPVIHRQRQWRNSAISLLKRQGARLGIGEGQPACAQAGERAGQCLQRREPPSTLSGLRRKFSRLRRGAGKRGAR